ncbi:hypothetical protein GCM10023331_30800 [Algivirga pacifica]|uniref:Outer membrane protein beta-barrel domain-containing protein n=2 Tax=Algivirga pacifica TaxID=1162670 RepID=A0ABP9DHS5_9BACT
MAQWSIGQGRSSNRYVRKIMDDSKFYAGFRVGAQYNNLRIVQSYNMLEQLAGSQEGYQKEYEGIMAQVQPSVAIQLYYYPVHVIGFTFQPTLSMMSWEYSNSYQWASENVNLASDYTFKHKITSFDLPLMAKLTAPLGNLQVYAQGGAYFSVLFDATKKVEIIDTEITNAGEFITESVRREGFEQQLQPYHWGYIAGGGLSIDVHTVRLGLEAYYKIPMQQPFLAEMRYQQGGYLSSIYDVMDDWEYSGLEVALSVTIPLDHIAMMYRSK